MLAWRLSDIYIAFQGSYECGPCPFGTIGTGLTGCVPGDPCLLNLDNCHNEFGECKNTGRGKFSCKVLQFLLYIFC